MLYYSIVILRLDRRIQKRTLTYQTLSKGGKLMRKDSFICRLAFFTGGLCLEEVPKSVCVFKLCGRLVYATVFAAVILGFLLFLNALLYFVLFFFAARPIGLWFCSEEKTSPAEKDSENEELVVMYKKWPTLWGHRIFPIWIVLGAAVVYFRVWIVPGVAMSYFREKVFQIGSSFDGTVLDYHCVLMASGTLVVCVILSLLISARKRRGYFGAINEFLERKCPRVSFD